MKRPTLRRKLLGWLALYLGLLTLTVFSAAYYVHEHAEHSVWRTLLNTELDSILHEIRTDPDYRWQNSDTLSFYSPHHARPFPDALAGLPPGLHDEVEIGERPNAVLVRETADLGRVMLALDITDFEELENFITRWAVLAGGMMFIVTLLMARTGMNRLVRPLSSLAADISQLEPERSSQSVNVDARGSAELEVIASAVNDYIERNRQFIERERVFISSASHELRTPIATITGAVELVLEHPDLPPRTRQQLQRVHTTAAGMEQLIHLLLLLARDPARLAALSEPVQLTALLPEIVADHHYLATGKELQFRIEAADDCVIQAPVGMVQAALGNLVRNAIENSDCGVITLTLSTQAVVTMDDPGHGMHPDEVAALYAKTARGTRNQRSGIGLDLIQRLCEHLGWRLTIHSHPGSGTRVTLDMRASLIELPGPA